MKTDGKLDSWVCLSGFAPRAVVSSILKTTSLVQYVFYIFGFLRDIMPVILFYFLLYLRECGLRKRVWFPGLYLYSAAFGTVTVRKDGFLSFSLLLGT